MSIIGRKSIKVTELNQGGMASILVVLIMSVVITLIVIGFAQVATREQSNALQAQLSTTAYYAAETGVNDAINIIKSNPDKPNADYAKDYCGNPANSPISSVQTQEALYDQLYQSNTNTTNFSTDNNGLGNTTYTCLLVNPSPSVLTTDVSSSSQVIPVDTAGQAIRTINLTWNSPNPNIQWSSNNCQTTNPPALPQPTSYNCALGILRIDLVPIIYQPTTPPSISKSALLTDAMTAFLIPNNSNQAPVNFTANSTSDTSPIYGASCTPAVGCKVSIDVGLSTNEFYLRVNTIYGGSGVLSLTATDNAGNNLPLTGAEYVIDSTGSSAGVLRRIQVAVPIVEATNIPGYAIQTTNDICKEFYIIPPTSPGGSGTPISSVEGSTTGDCTSEGY